MAAGDLIFAEATAAGRAGVAVFRISGRGAGSVFEALTGRPPPPPRRASLRLLTDPRDGAPIDQALTLWFPGPESFTGEDVVELHVHGGRAVATALAEALAVVRGARPAEPGEFTRRAFRQGKLDLAEAEGLADLIHADTAAARRQALWQMRGGLSALYRTWREELIGILALAEAALDFSDEPVPPDLEAEVLSRIAALHGKLAAQLAGSTISERLSDGFRVVLTGAPNVGKSSLLNALARRDAAIVTAVPGTTRDVLEVKLDLCGYPVSLYDTAGLRESSDPIEAEGVRRARLAAADADLIVDVRVVGGDDVGEAEDPSAGNRLVFWNKCDVDTPPSHVQGLRGSARTGDGLGALESALTAAAKEAIEGSQTSAITRARHRASVMAAVEALERAQSAAAPELLAEDLRGAMTALGRVVGVVDVEDVLDRIFAAFCIGK